MHELAVYVLLGRAAQVDLPGRIEQAHAPSAGHVPIPSRFAIGVWQEHDELKQHGDVDHHNPPPARSSAIPHDLIFPYSGI
jgi:hypothetical protein